jgi:hypothetical protein
MSLIKDKDNIKTNIFSINKIKNNKIKNVTKQWKIYYDDDTVLYEYLTDFEVSFVISDKNLFFNNSILGKNLYDSGYYGLDTINVIKFELCNDDGTPYLLPRKYRPSKDIVIDKSSNEFDLNSGLLGLFIFKRGSVTNYLPKTVTLTVATEGTIIITGCEFIATENNNLILDNFDVIIN